MVRRGSRLIAEWTEKSIATKADFSSDGRWLAISFSTGEIEIREAKLFKVERRWKTDSAVVRSVLFSNDSSRLFCGGSNGAVHVYDSADWREVSTLYTASAKNKSDPTIDYLTFSSDGTTLLAYREDGLVQTWRGR